MSNSVVVVTQSETDGRRMVEQIDAAGFHGVYAADLQQALERLRSRDAGLCLSHAAFAQALLPDSKAAAPLVPVVIFDDQQDVNRAVAAIRQGAVDYLGESTNASDLVAKVQEHFSDASNVDVIQASPNTQRSFDLAARVAQTNVSVLILGESGTGKEVVARYIHQVSKRAHAPYVAINCAAIPDNMLEAILFGHVKGAFTGAHQSQPGKFELADGGTLLLDEISEMPLGLQAKLLRALQEREVERVGARTATAVDVRVIATSNVDLKAAVAEGKFREDLYYRLSVFPLHLDPLRRRPEDVLALADHFVAKHGLMQGRNDARLTLAAQRALCDYSWPGNVRELENTIQRSLVLATGADIDTADLALSAATSSPADASAGADGDAVLSTRLQGAEEQMILDRLRANDGQRRLTARQLGISERTLRYKLQKLRAAGVEEI